MSPFSYILITMIVPKSLLQKVELCTFKKPSPQKGKKRKAVNGRNRNVREVSAEQKIISLTWFA